MYPAPAPLSHQPAAVDGLDLAKLLARVLDGLEPPGDRGKVYLEAPEVVGTKYRNPVARRLTSG
jgi:hypothetical protein